MVIGNKEKTLRLSGENRQITYKGMRIRHLISHLAPKEIMEGASKR